uniref:Uncharacterized protein n=1 Tax=Acrobeloides nanus TaxID=290746 RepID=A0A914CSN9_9BILA
MGNSTLIKMKVYDNTQLEFNFVDIDLSSNSSLMIYNSNYLLLKHIFKFNQANKYFNIVDSWNNYHV